MSAAAETEDFGQYNVEYLTIADSSFADIGGPAAFDIVEGLRDTATRKALPDAYAVLDLLNERMASSFAEGGEEICRKTSGLGWAASGTT